MAQTTMYLSSLERTSHLCDSEWTDRGCQKKYGRDRCLDCRSDTMSDVKQEALESYGGIFTDALAEAQATAVHSSAVGSTLLA